METTRSLLTFMRIPNSGEFSDNKRENIKEESSTDKNLKSKNRTYNSSGDINISITNSHLTINLGATNDNIDRRKTSTNDDYWIEQDKSYRKSIDRFYRLNI